MRGRRSSPAEEPEAEFDRRGSAVFSEHLWQSSAGCAASHNDVAGNLHVLSSDRAIDRRYPGRWGGGGGGGAGQESRSLWSAPKARRSQRPRTRRQLWFRCKTSLRSSTTTNSPAAADTASAAARARTGLIPRKRATPGGSCRSIFEQLPVREAKHRRCRSFPFASTLRSGRCNRPCRCSSIGRRHLELHRSRSFLEIRDCR